MFGVHMLDLKDFFVKLSSAKPSACCTAIWSYWLEIRNSRGYPECYANNKYRLL